MSTITVAIFTLQHELEEKISSFYCQQEIEVKVLFKIVKQYNYNT